MSVFFYFFCYPPVSEVLRESCKKSAQGNSNLEELKIYIELWKNWEMVLFNINEIQNIVTGIIEEFPKLRSAVKSSSCY
jgi:hypothetical protein